jgi:hypothetical protein
MNTGFSELFTETKAEPGIPLYTACIAVKIFIVLCKCGRKGGQKDIAAFKKCDRPSEHERLVPDEYVVLDKEKHCLRYEYWFKDYVGLDNNSWIKELCDKANCLNNSDIDKLHDDITWLELKYKAKNENSFYFDVPKSGKHYP